MRPGDRFFSLDEICQRYDVSSITARRALNELEHEGWINKYKYKGTFVARNHTPLKVKLITNYTYFDNGLAVEDSGFINVKLVDEIRKAAERLGMELQLFTPVFGSSGVTGQNIVVLQGSALSSNVLQSLCRDNNVVLAHVPEPVDNTSSVSLDMKKGISMAVRHLASLGHKRIGFILTRITNNWMIPRFLAYESGLKRHGLAFDWKLVMETFQTDSSSVYSAMDRLMENPLPPTAIMASNDEIALTIMRYCRERGISIPRQLSVVGYDNVPDGGESIPGLTTVDARLDRVADEALRLILDADRRQGRVGNVVVLPEPVIRGSTAPPIS